MFPNIPVTTCAVQWGTLVALFYCILVFGLHLPIWATIMVNLVFVVSTAIMYLILDMGSQPILMSGKNFAKMEDTQCR